MNLRSTVLAIASSVCLAACAPVSENANELVPTADGKADGQGAGSIDRDPSSSFEYRPFTPAGAAFVRGWGDAAPIDPSDVWQDGISDCWLMSSMASVARVNPAAIERLIQLRSDGRYNVTLYVGAKHHDADGTVYRDARVFIVAPTFPTKSDGTLAYAKPQDLGAEGPEMWPLLLEKAYAQDLGRYEGDIPLFGSNLSYDITPAFRQLLPRGDQDTYDPDQQSLDRIMEVLGKAFDEQRPTTALVTSPGPVGTAFRAQYGIDTWHHYSVAKIDRVARTVDLQDPRADEHHPTGVPIAVFRTVFSWYTVGPPAK